MFPKLPVFIAPLCAVLCLSALAPAVACADPLTGPSLSVYAQSIVWDATRGRFFMSTSAGDPKQPASIVMVNPDTALVEDTIPVGDSPGAIAISADGQYLYASIDSKGVVRRFHLPSHTPDFDITTGSLPAGSGQGNALTVLPNQPQSIVVANGTKLVVYDGQTPRGTTAPFASTQVFSLYTRLSNGIVYGYNNGVISTLTITATGVGIAASQPAFPFFHARVNWSGGMATDDWGYVYNLDTGVMLGQVALPAGVLRCITVADPTGTSVLSIPTNASTTPAVLGRFSLSSFEPIQQSASLSASIAGATGDDVNGAQLYNWGTDGVAIYGSQTVTFIHTATTLTNVTAAPLPVPKTDSSGIIHVAVPAAGLVYDSQRNLIWASVAASGGAGIGNNLIAIDPSTGNISTAIPAGSNPGGVAISSDQQRVFAALRGSTEIASINLNSQSAETPYPVVTTLNQYLNGGLDSGLMIPHAVASVPGQPQSVVAISDAYLASTYMRRTAVYSPTGELPQTFTKTVDAIMNGDASNAFFAQNDSTSDFALYRLVVNSGGITLNEQLNSLAEYFGDQPVFANGYFYDGDGQVWTADTTKLLGSFAGEGVAVPLPDLNAVIYADASISNGISFLAFDLTTYLPTGGLGIKESAVDSSANSVSAAIRAGTNQIAAIVGGEVLIVPLNRIESFPTLTPALQTVAPGVQESNVPVYAIAVAPGSSQLVVSTPSTALNLGNALMTMNPATGTTGPAVLAGSEPSLVAMSPDGNYAYTYLAGTGTLARINLATGTRDLTFSDDPTGQGQQYYVWDLAVGADGGLAVSYPGGQMAIFDQGILRPQTDANTDNFDEFSANYQLAFDDTGTRLYGYDQWVSSWGLKTWSVAKTGVAPISLAPGLTNSYYTQIKFADGFLYSSNGDVIDPRKSRDIGQFTFPGLDHRATDGYHLNAAVYPDLDTGRVYFLYSNQIIVFDMYTYALLGTMNLPQADSNYLSLLKVGQDKLAFTTVSGELFFIQISAIPVNSAAAGPAPVYSLPQTSGVAVMDLAVSDLVYDSSRDLIYASVPGSEGERADTIVAIKPGEMAVTTSWPAGPNPTRMAISGDDSELYFSMGEVNNSGEYVGSKLRRIDLGPGTISSQFAAAPTEGSYISIISDLTVPTGEPQSIAVINDFFGSGSVTVFDGVTPRPVAANSGYLCTSIQPGATSSRLYCYNGYTTDYKFSRLALDSTGVTVVDSSGPTLIGGGGGQILFNNGRIYTGNGKIIDPEAYQLLGSVAATGSVAVDGNVAYWLAPGTSSTNTVTIQAFDTTSFALLYTRTINVGTGAVSRLIPCGQGRLAFAVGNQLFVIYPNGTVPATPAPSAGGLVNAASGAAGVSQGSLASLYGANLVPSGILDLATAFPLPTAIDGVSITVAGRLVPILGVANTNGTGQINFQIPFGLAGHGSVPLIVNNGGFLSAPMNIQVLSAQPGVYLVNGQGVLLHSDYSYVTANSPAARGETIIVYCNGLGAVSPWVDTGSAAPTTSLAFTATPQVTIGNAQAQVAFSGLTPGLAGLDQLNVVVPENAASGVGQLVITAGGVTSVPVSIAIQ